jgi:hypothetical protein
MRRSVGEPLAKRLALEKPEPSALRVDRLKVESLNGSASELSSTIKQLISSTVGA